ncbi:MAG: glycosyltransferase family 2 protein [Acidobacteriota bacterium]|nr:MAG: glycosyltransferase family 2 protein [Acidobacteriota bacterium]
MSEPFGPDTLVSVVVPTYNRADYVAATIESVLAQTHPRVECVVIDDGSTDGTEQVLSRFRDRIVSKRQQNAGLAAARNAGIRASRGELIGFLDSDDLWEPRLVEAVIDTLRRYPDAGAVFLAERTIDPGGRLVGHVHTKKSPGVYFTPEGMIGRDTGVGSGRPPVARRSVLEHFGSFDESFRNYAVDCAMWIPLSFEVPMVLLAEPLVRRRVHPGNVSGDIAMDARAWLRILDRIEAEQPSFCAEHRRLMRRTRAKQHLRIGRELLERSADRREQLSEARAHLWSALSKWPWFARGWVYLVWSLVAPTSYGSFRTTERRWR